MTGWIMEVSGLLKEHYCHIQPLSLFMVYLCLINPFIDLVINPNGAVYEYASGHYLHGHLQQAVPDVEVVSGHFDYQS